MDDDDQPPYSQEVMRQDDLVFPSYNFGSAPTTTASHTLRMPFDGSQQGEADGGGFPGGTATAAAVMASSGGGGGATASDLLEATPMLQAHPQQQLQQQLDGDMEASEAVAAAANSGGGRRGRGRALHGKIFSDPIHETYRLDPIAVSVMDTPQFQRLRELHQLGLTHLVFPGAVHSRFEHSLGTSYKAFEVADRIFRTQGRELAMEKDDIWLVALAGLCHDLGHGPFSHVWEYEFLPRRAALLGPDEEDKRAAMAKWHHETMSTRILEHLVDDNNLEGIEQEHIRRVSDFIRGDFHEDRGFLFDIVNNKRNGVDVDKVDYLQRDAKMCGVNLGVDFKRLHMMTKVIDNQICYKWSEYSNLWDLFHARESMHRRVYTHRKTKAVEFMVCDALVEADQALGFSEAMHDPEEFCGLNDTLLSLIENYGLFSGRRKGQSRSLTAHPQRQQRQNLLAPPELDNGADKCLEKAQAIIKRLRCRQLYKYANQITVPQEFLQSNGWQDLSLKFTAAEVASCRSGGLELRPEHIIVSATKIDYTQGEKNPLDSILFFDHEYDNVGRRIDPHQVVGILPQFHQERILRVYTPELDPAYQTAVEEAFRVWCRRRFGSKAQMATPARPARNPDSFTRELARQNADPYRGPPSMRPPPAPPGSGTVTAGNVGAAGALRAAGAASGAGCGLSSGAAGTTAAAGSAAGASRVGGDGVGGGSGGGGGTPTRSTPVMCGGGGGRGGGSEVAAAESEGAAADDGGGRAKRPRSSASLFPDS